MIRESWLEPISPESPCGPDLAYDPDFLALEAASRGKEEQQFGDTIIPAEEPNWPDVVERAGALLDRTHDLRVVHLFARGLARVRGLDAAAEALELARDLVARYWEPVHPQLVIDGEPDPVVRMNALGEFAAAQGFVRDVRSATFLRTPSIAITVRDVESILDRAVGTSEGGVGADQFRATLAEAIAADTSALGAVPRMLEAVNAIRSTLLANLEPALLPDFGPLTSLLKPVAEAVDAARAAATGAAAAGETSSAGGAAGSSAPGEIRTREDVVRLLDRICEFLARTEPSNPAPLLIRRAQRLMSMSFLDIIRDLAPEATGQVETITGARGEG